MDNSHETVIQSDVNRLKGMRRNRLSLWTLPVFVIEGGMLALFMFYGGEVGRLILALAAAIGFVTSTGLFWAIIKMQQRLNTVATLLLSVESDQRIRVRTSE